VLAHGLSELGEATVFLGDDKGRAILVIAIALQSRPGSGRRRRRLWGVVGEQFFDQASPMGDLSPQLPAAPVAGCLQLLQADRGVGDLGADCPANELSVMKDADLGQIARVVERIVTASPT
jgi:hypothetical protein